MSDFIPDDQFKPDPTPAAATVAQPSPSSPTPDFIPDSHFKADEEEHGGIGSQLGAAAEGVAQGVLGPLAPMAEKALDIPEQDIAGRAAANPVAHGVGEFGGLVGSLATGAGEGAVAEKLGAAIAPKVTEATGLLGKVTSATGKAAVENMVIQAGDEGTKMVLHDPDQTAQSAIIDVGLAGLIGGGIGGAIGTVSPLWEAAKGSKIAGTLNDISSTLKHKVENPDPVSHLAEELQGARDSVDALSQHIFEEGGLKESEIRSQLPKNVDAFGQSDTMSTNGRKLIAKLERDKAPQGIINQVTDAVDRFETNALKASDSSDSYPKWEAVNNYKKELDSVAKWEKKTQDFGAQQALGAVKEHVGDVRANLEDSSIWGKAGDTQRELNKGFSDLQGKTGPLRQFDQTFTRNLAGDTTVDKGKAQTFLNQLGNPKAEIKQSMLDNFIKGHDAYHDVVQKVYDRLGILNPNVKAPLTFARSTVDNKITSGVKIANWMYDKGLSGASGAALGAAAGETLGHATGIPGMWALVGEHALGPLYSRAVQAMVPAIASKATSASGFKAGIDYVVNALKGQNAIGKAGKAIFKAERELLPQQMIPNKKDRDKLDTRLKGAQTNPETLMKVGGKTSVYLPEHGTSIAKTATQAVNYLNSLRPSTDKASPLDTKPVLNSTSKAAYNRALDIAQQPLMVMKHIKDGTLQPQDVVALKVMYPALYSKFSSEIMNNLNDQLTKGNSIPYQTRLSISMFMGQPLDSTMQPQAIINAQAGASKIAQQAAQPEPNGKISQGAASGLNKVASSYQTPMQNREQERSVKS